MDAREIVKKYLNSPGEELALFINGEWGSGKTYFIRNLSEDVIGGKKIIYLSLFGISSLKELNEKVDGQILSSYLFEQHKSVGVVGGLIGRNITHIAELIGPYASETSALVKSCGAILNGSVSAISNFIKNRNKNYVFCFDDLERSSLSPKLVLGYINFFIEDGYKTIILANESQLLINNEIENGGIACYKQFKEKVVAHSLEFKMELEKELIGITGKWGLDKNVLDDIKKNKEFLLKMLQDLRCYNLRTIRFAINAFSDLHKEISNHDKFKTCDEEIKNIFWRELLMQCIGVSYYIKEKNDVINNWSPGEVEKDIKYITTEEKTKSLTVPGQILWTMKSVCDYMKKYYYDKDEMASAIEIIIERIDFKVKRASDPFNLILEWMNSSERDVISWLDEIVKNIRDGKYKIADYGQILERIAKPVELLGKMDYLNKIFLAMKENIESSSDIDDNCVIRTPLYENCEIEKKVNILSETVTKKRCDFMKKQGEEILKAPEIIKDIYKFYHENLGKLLRERTFLNFFDVKILAEAVCKKKKTMWDFCRLLEEIYGMDNIREIYPHDDSRLEKLKKCVLEIKNKQSGLDKLDLLRYGELFKCIDEVLKCYCNCKDET